MKRPTPAQLDSVEKIVSYIELKGAPTKLSDYCKLITIGLLEEGWKYNGKKRTAHS